MTMLFGKRRTIHSFLADVAAKVVNPIGAPP
ncbi:MAG: hypothetical protein FD124_574 [Alphaproteobacteria bacterium]|nr:MAG: hypothetical protein FD160_442 [Caulobacteraceae bacterium]TPW08213.1 MAG: hypothetical protein FD124_574 [Alphaproteobacteria bacterium]